MHSPNVVADDEVLERELRRNVERSETGKPTEAAFRRIQLLGKNETGLSVNRLLRRAAVARNLLQPRSDRRLQAAAQHLALNHENFCSPPTFGQAISRSTRPRPSPNSRPPAAVEHPLQKRLQQKLRPGLRVREAVLPMHRVLAEERLERRPSPRRGRRRQRTRPCLSAACAFQVSSRGITSA